MTTDSSAQDGTREIIEVARASTEPHEVEPGKLYVLNFGDRYDLVDLGGDEYQEFPKHKAGHVTVENVASFTQYYAKHADDNSEAFADLDQGTVTAVLDAHMAEAGGARWGNHRITLALHQTEPWKAWTGLNGRMVSQAAFAEFIEEHATDVAVGEGISAADLIELAQKFQAATKVEFSSGHRLQSGETQLVYAETIEAKAGNRGSIEVPSQFTLALRPFDDAQSRYVLARFRYRISHGQLTLGYALDQPERVVREAVAEVVVKAQEELTIEIMRGKP
jgi:uncharacterized protein YfdQ (DUF2303 family)